MKKRIVCVLLTLIMLVSLVPVTALTASAASLKTSEAAITIMKKLAIFKSTCYQVPGTNEFRIGYGTVCSEKHETKYEGGKVVSSDAGKHHVTQAQADQALRKLILDLDAKVNSFASANSLTLSQCQHDALVLFTFDVGDSWMSGSGVVKSAIVSKASTNDLLKAMSDWASNQDDFRRRKIEVNMYKNGIYSDVVPSSFGTVTYNPDAGTLSQSGTNPYQVLFDTTKTTAHVPTPTRSGYKFMGWYSAQYDGVLVPSLTGSYNGKTLWAGWQATSVTANNANDLSYVHGINETLKVSQLASLNVYPVPTSKNVKPFRTINKDTATVTAIKDFIDDNGNRWCKLSAAGDGWVLLKTSGQSAGGSDYNGGKIDVTVTVTNSYVNRRASDSASSAKNGVYTAGTKLKIIATNDAKTWGQVEENGVAVGWVALMYTDWSTVYDGSSPSDANNTTPIAKATVTYVGYLNVRSDPGVDNKIVGSFAMNTTVDIFEIRTVNGHRWGRTSSGWICLTYTSVKMLTDKNVSDQGVLDYAFEVTMADASADLKTYSEPTTNSVASDTIKAGTTGLKITNAALVDGKIWVKAHWTVKETDKNGKTNVIAKSGWVTYSSFKLVPTKFTIVSDTLNIRSGAGSDNDFVFKLTKGVEVEVHEISLVGEEIWGRIEGYVSDGVNYDGWINLASNYAKRSSKITIDGGTKGAIGTGTVVNADSVRVRMTGALYGQVLGSINRGTKVAVLEEKDGWYKIDFDVDNNKETDSWIYGQYLQVQMGTVDSDTTNSDGNSSSDGTKKTDGTGKGIVANTYSGVNVRSGAGIGYNIVGKILNGTEVTILEVKLVGTAKWGRVSQGWICMDYVTMISYDDIPGNNSNNNSSNGNKGTGVDSFDEVERTTTTAVYTGTIKSGAAFTTVYKTPNPNLEDNTVRAIGAGENITIYELTAVTLEIYEGDKVDDSNKNNDVETVVKQTSYWARINDGWIKDPDVNIQLNALAEKVHTVTGASNLNVYTTAGSGDATSTTVAADARLKKGDQVPVTKLEIVKNSANRTLTVWGRVETSDGIVGYCDLSYMSEGALYEKDKNTTTTTPTTAPAPTIGSTGNTGDGGFVSNGSGYKYTGKVINTTSLNVRVTPSTGAKKATTLKGGASLVIYETKISEDMAWGRCDAGWVYLYYVDLTPASGSSAIDARVVYNDNTIIYTDNAASSVAGTYSRMSVIDIYEYVGDMARTDLGWVSTGNLL